MKGKPNYLEDIHNVVHHGICSTQLRPNMGEHSTVDTDDISRIKHLHPGRALVLALESRDKLANVGNTIEI
jgi:hypothetical protein